MRSTAPFAVSAAPSRARGRWLRAPVRRTTAAIASPTNGPDEFSSVTSRVHIAQSPETFAYDDDGNQTLITTKTGLWRVTYNGENRPILWVRDSDNTTLSMCYDHMGRRREKNAQRFFYDGYLQVADNNANTYTWDCTERVATRPLSWLRANSSAFYTHDGNKSVSEVVDVEGSVSAHYEYAPFGAVISQLGSTAAANPWRFSSESAEDDTATVYYNYRHYEPVMGRWTSRDPLNVCIPVARYVFCGNRSFSTDWLGLIEWNYVGSTELRDFSDDDIKRVMINSKKHGMPNSDCIPQAITKTEADVIVGCKCDSSRGMWYLNSVKVEVADFVHLRPEGKYNTPELVDGRKMWDAKAPTLSWVRSKEQDHVNDTKDFVEKQKKDQTWKDLEDGLKQTGYRKEQECKRNIMK